MRKISFKTVCAILAGAGIFYFLGCFATIPSPIHSVNICLQFGFLAFAALLLGPVPGCLIGLLGHILVDLSIGQGIWWSWAVGSGLFGLLCGFGFVMLRVDRCSYSPGNLLRFNLVQLVSNLVCWGLVAPFLDVWTTGDSPVTVLWQGLSAAAVNTLITALIGTLLFTAYAATVSKNGMKRR